MADINRSVCIEQGNENTRVRLGCEHQRGLLYVTRAEKSWVCNEDDMPGHALAGFLGELTAQQDSRVDAMMQRWGIYFRSLPLTED